MVDGLETLPRRGSPDDEPTPAVDLGDAGRVVGVDRFPELEHHVVAHVDDIAHRSLAGGSQPHLDAVR